MTCGAEANDAVLAYEVSRLMLVSVMMLEIDASYCGLYFVVLKIVTHYN